MITLEELKAIMPSAGRRADRIYDGLVAAMDACQINTPVRMAMFLSNVAHESAELIYMSEIWGPAQVPVQKTYATRMGNNRAEAIAIALAHGDADPGHYFRGYGPIQVTGFDNQCRIADHFGIQHNDMVEWLQTPEGGCKASAFFWMDNGLNELADAENYDNLADEFDAVCDKINFGHRTPRLGDANGWNDRMAHYDRAKAVLCSV